ncbi:MAG: hypothetical protein KGJ57_15200 [Sphingomonadales bacterium]|nr:hypothetical protein [Sphingomonadales bacterium]MDE2170751.1 hypothetical protein [Sphingomonadales bacterium]
MSAVSDSYLAQAAKSRREADETTLANVREIRLRSAAAWQAMGERAKLIEMRREERIAGQSALSAL